MAVFCLPPHTTHECQPLDCSFFGPLKKHWQEVCHSFYQENPGQVISKLNFCRIFKPAWLKTVTPENIINGFKKAGVYPYNPSAIPLPKARTGDGDKGDGDSTGDEDNNGDGNGGEDDLGGSGETGAACGGGKQAGGDDDSVDGGAGCRGLGGASNHNDGAGIGHGSGVKAGENDGYLNGNGERGDHSSSESCQDRETFTTAQVEQYSHRLKKDMTGMILHM